jgi:hypothetical protein
MRMSPCLWILMWMFLAHFCPWFWMCTLWRMCLQIWIKFNVKVSKS